MFTELRQTSNTCGQLTVSKAPCQALNVDSPFWPWQVTLGREMTAHFWQGHPTEGNGADPGCPGLLLACSKDVLGSSLSSQFPSDKKQKLILVRSHVHCSVSHNSQGMETTWVSDTWLDKRNVVCLFVVAVQSLSRIWLFAAPRTAACQASPH